MIVELFLSGIRGKNWSGDGGPPGWGGSPTKIYRLFQKKVTNRKIFYPKLSVVELNFPIGMTWVHLIWFCRKGQKNISGHKGSRLLVIEPVHRGSSSILLKELFLGYPIV